MCESQPSKPSVGGSIPSRRAAERASADTRPHRRATSPLARPSRAAFQLLVLCGLTPRQARQELAAARAQGLSMARNPELGSASAGGGIGLFGALFLVLLVLKLLGKITLSWWWVTAPLWGGFAACVGIFLAMFIGVAIAEFLFSGPRRRR